MLTVEELKKAKWSTSMFMDGTNGWYLQAYTWKDIGLNVTGDNYTEATRTLLYNDGEIEIEVKCENDLQSFVDQYNAAKEAENEQR